MKEGKDEPPPLPVRSLAEKTESFIYTQN